MWVQQVQQSPTIASPKGLLVTSPKEENPVTDMHDPYPDLPPLPHGLRIDPEDPHVVDVSRAAQRVVQEALNNQGDVTPDD